jgi:hypothetical protein
MKSFRLRWKYRPTPPERHVSDYSAEERERLRATFAPIAADRRLHRLVCGVAFAGFMILMLLARISLKSNPLPWWKALPWWHSWGMISCFLLAIGAAVLSPGATCPGCSNDAENSFGRYCPDCGRRQLEPGSFWSSPFCGACRKTMYRNRGRRRYKIRFCTHCGVPLDEKGF